MKIGDKVRFLNAVGGGIVKKFQGKDIVLVEEEDGFETPVLARECIVIEGDGTQFRSPSKSQVTVQQPQPVIPEKKTEEKKEITELPGGDKLNVYLAYLPENIKDLGKCTYEAYFINDSNYFLFFNYMSRENNAWKSRFHGIIEPNTKEFIEEFAKEQLNDLERICIQLIAFKKDKPYMLKNTQSVEMKIDPVKFYKLHSFRENDFFEDEALIYPVVIDDIPERELLISASDLQEAMTQKVRIDAPKSPAPARQNKEIAAIVEVDLHINELLDSTTGMNNADMLNYQLNKFREALEKFKNKKGQKIVFIHGKGEGVLRNALLSELKTKYKNYPYQDASFKEYGFGATMVTIK